MTGTLSLVLPTLNEAGSLTVLLPELLALRDVQELIVVDDGSSDATGALVQQAAATDPRVRWYPRRGPASLTASLVDGIALSKGALVGWMDADGTMSAADVERLVAAVRDGADVAVGSRFAAGGRMKGQTKAGWRGRVTSLRNLRGSRDAGLPNAMSWLLNTVVLPALLGRGVHDYTSGFIVARREVFDAVTLSGEHGEYFIHLWMDVCAHGFRVTEVPYAAGTRLAGHSKTVAAWPDYLRRARQYLGAALVARQQR